MFFFIIIQTVDLFNTALLSGYLKIYPIKIYALYSHSEQIVEFGSSECKCQTNSTQFKVNSNCNEVYFDASESENSEPTRIEINCKGHTTFQYLNIYQPEIPLIIESSRNELFKISTWPLYVNDEDSIDGTQAQEDEDCYEKYQLSLVNAYARFYLIDERNSEKQYLKSDKTDKILELNVNNYLKFDIDRLDLAEITNDRMIVARKAGEIKIKVRRIFQYIFLFLLRLIDNSFILFN